jgi:hypothetical protein
MFRDPISGFYDGGEKGSGPCLILGFVNYLVLIVHDDGKFDLTNIDSVTPDIRYNWLRHEWIEVGDIGQETADDGGSQLSGSVPDPDSTSDGDQVDAQGGPPSGDPGNMDTREAGAPGS